MSTKDVIKYSTIGQFLTKIHGNVHNQWNMSPKNFNTSPPNFEWALNFISLQGAYTVRIPENSPGGRFVTNVQATDKDKGDYGVVRYALDPQETRFTINNMSVGWARLLYILFHSFSMRVFRPLCGGLSWFVDFYLLFFIQGEIFVAPGAKLDREEVGDLDIQVIASDSPLDSTVRRYSTVTVSMSSLDFNQ
jgi:hypothetical protein